MVPPQRWGLPLHRFVLLWKSVWGKTRRLGFLEFLKPGLFWLYGRLSWLWQLVLLSQQKHFSVISTVAAVSESQFGPLKHADTFKIFVCRNILELTFSKISGKFAVEINGS